MPKIALPAALVALAALSACDSTAPVPAPSGQATGSSDASSSPIETASPSPSPTPSSPATPPAGTNFPAAMQGRWGLTAADCTARPGDTRTLLTIGAKDIRFYESVATIRTVKESSATRLRATLAYEGEGMQWNRDALLEVRPAANQLVMEEFGSDAVPGARTYARCK